MKCLTESFLFSPLFITHFEGKKREEKGNKTIFFYYIELPNDNKYGKEGLHSKIAPIILFPSLHLEVLVEMKRKARLQCNSKRFHLGQGNARPFLHVHRRPLFRRHLESLKDPC